MVSNINNQIGLENSIFVLNYITDQYASYKSRGGFSLLKRMAGEPTNWIQDLKNNKSYYTTSNNIIDYDTGTIIYSQLNPIKYPTSIKVCNKIFWADGEKIVEYDTVTGYIGRAQYSPRKYFSASNAFLTTAGSNLLLVYIPDHGLTNNSIVNSTFSLRGFTEYIAPNAINISDILASNITIIDQNRIAIAYPNNFTATVTNPIGGSGLLEIKYPKVDFPAGSIIETKDNRIFISGNENEPTRIFQSNLITPEDCEVRFSENIDDFLNLGFSSIATASFDFTLDQNTYSKVIAIKSHSFGVYVFTDSGVLRGDGDFKNGIFPVFMNDTCVNPLAVDSGEGILCFKGTNAVYESLNGTTFNSISDENDWYIKSCDNSRVRVKIFDGKVFVTLGDMEDFQDIAKSKDSNEEDGLGTGFSFAKISDGSTPTINHLKGLCYVYSLRQETHVLWSNLNGNLLILQSVEKNFSSVKELWTDTGENGMARYDKFGFNDYNNTAIPHIAIEHIKFPNGLFGKCKFESVMLSHQNTEGVKLKYRVYDTSVDDLFHEAKVVSSGNCMTEYKLVSNNQGRGIMLYFDDYTNIRQSVLNNYVITFDIK